MFFYLRVIDCIVFTIITMGQDNPAVKQTLFAFGEGAIFKELPQNCVFTVWIFDHTSHLKYLPRDYKKKEKSPLTNGYDYVMNFFIKRPAKAFRKGANFVYICLDRGSPINKSIEHKKRYKGVVPMETPLDYHNSPSLINDYQMTIKNDNEWKSFISNPFLYRRLIHYITMRLIGTRGNIDDALKEYIENSSSYDYNDNLDDFTLDPYGDKSLFLHGGRLSKPDPNRPLYYTHPEPFLLEFKTKTMKTILTESNRVNTVKNTMEKTPDDKKRKNYDINESDTTGLNSKEPFNKKTKLNNGNGNGSSYGKYTEKITEYSNTIYETKRSVTIRRDYNQMILNNLLEGEVAAMYYAQMHIERGENVMFESPDIDMLMMLLLSCPDRLDPVSGNFICNVFVHLKVSTPGLSRYVDVHKLWVNIYQSKPMPIPKQVPSKVFKKFENTSEYVSKICAMCLLCGTDYVKNYCKGVTNRKDGFIEDLFKNTTCGTDFIETKIGKSVMDVKPVPWIVYVFLKYYEEFDEMITIYRNNSSVNFNVIETIRNISKVDINEDLFIKFTHRVFTESIIEGVQKNKFKQKYGDNNSIKNIRTFLYEDKKLELQKKLETERKRDERLKNPNAKVPKKITHTDEAKAMTKIKENRLPPKRKIRVSSRHLLWQMEYMLNSYKTNCTIIDPTTIYIELPYYGWIISTSGYCKVAARVPIKRPDLKETQVSTIKNRRNVTLKAMVNSSKLRMPSDSSLSESEDNDSIECK